MSQPACLFFFFQLITGFRLGKSGSQQHQSQVSFVTLHFWEYWPQAPAVKNIITVP